MSIALLLRLYTLAVAIDQVQLYFIELARQRLILLSHCDSLFNLVFVIGDVLAKHGWLHIHIRIGGNVPV